MVHACAEFVWTSIRARLILFDKHIGTSASIYAYVTEKSHTKNVMYFLDRGCTLRTPLVWLRHRPILSILHNEAHL